MGRILAAFSALVLLGVSSLAFHQQANPAAQQSGKPATAAPFVIPPEAAEQPNPVKPTANSIAEGKRMYGYDCAMCHGASGDGKGDLAADMKLNLKDYRDPVSLKGLSDGEVFYIIQKGKGEMTGEGDRQKPEEIWNMVNYLRSLSKKASAAAKTKPQS